jgi:hypothetical protein
VEGVVERGLQDRKYAVGAGLSAPLTVLVVAERAATTLARYS